MNAKEREAFYDTEIAPELLKLGQRCRDNGLSLHAIVEWEPGETGRTRFFEERKGISMELSDTLFFANGNIDAFLFHLMKRARKTGHSSIVLHQLGVPHEPTAEQA